jgi:phosphotriesterase-related protein
VFADVVRQLKAVRDRGIRSIVDATAFGHGRDVDFVRRVSEAADLNIIVSTGIYTYDSLPFFFDYHPVVEDRADVMVEMFVRDITSGIGITGVRAAIIKCATDEAGVTPNIERVLRAAARAHRETGAPITTHTVAKLENGMDQQRIFASEGVDLSRVIIGHSGDSGNLSYLRELMDEGSTIGADRFGMHLPGYPRVEERVTTVAQLCELGYADRIVLSHDFTCHMDWFAPGTAPFPEEWKQTYLSDVVIPALHEQGVSEGQIQQMMVENPRAIFATHDPY